MTTKRTTTKTKTAKKIGGVGIARA
jgi:hypothetical protein